MAGHRRQANTVTNKTNDGSKRNDTLGRSKQSIADLSRIASHPSCNAHGTVSTVSLKRGRSLVQVHTPPASSCASVASFLSNPSDSPPKKSRRTSRSKTSAHRPRPDPITPKLTKPALRSKSLPPESSASRASLRLALRTHPYITSRTSLSQSLRAAHSHGSNRDAAMSLSPMHGSFAGHAPSVGTMKGNGEMSTPGYRISRWTGQPSSSSTAPPDPQARPSSPPPLMYPPTPSVEPMSASVSPPPADFSSPPRVCGTSSVHVTGESSQNTDDAVKDKNVASDLMSHSPELEEVIGLPWVPLMSDQTDVYIPPLVHRLVNAMKRELEAETRARCRAESMYNEEVRKRIALEQRLEQLQRARSR